MSFPANLPPHSQQHVVENYYPNPQSGNKMIEPSMAANVPVMNMNFGENSQQRPWPAATYGQPTPYSQMPSRSSYPASQPQPMNVAGSMQAQGTVATDNFGGPIDYASLPPDIIQCLKLLGANERPYFEKVCQLRVYLNLLRSSLSKYRTYPQMIPRIEFAMSILLFERYFCRRPSAYIIHYYYL
jgi:hypothetical protein